MLQIKDIRKEYRTGDLVQKALDGVSLNLRDNEFVAILGPSGSGKTTLLNIIGGLDRYDSGDLIINGISTRKYRDGDWDSYRNHTIGFVFQSYNLIPHQTVLSNVELALTISGISKAERKKRALQALAAVGLEEQAHKKPNQMSGGQMQRVALARALVNDPDILLADEPTGALDSATSIQVMDLLKEVAKDRLVVMVTHNPELAHQYATRIVSVKDGKIISDSDPYIVEDNNETVRHENMGRSSMSFLTALSLSFNNLLTKKARTFLVSFAGSIGIIGIALILSLSTGVNAYVHQTEENALSEYPLEITGNAMNMSSMMADHIPQSEETKKGEVQEASVISSMMSTISENDLGSLKEYFESGDSGIEEYVRAVEYRYNVEPLVYMVDEEGKPHQVNPNTMLASSGLMPTSSIYSSMFTTSVFSALPEEESLYRSSYDVKAGRWPENANELVIVLTDSGRVSDMVLYSLGMKDYSEFEAMIKNLGTSSEEVETEKGTYSYQDFIGIQLRLVDASDCYVKDENLNVYTDMREDESYMKQLVSEGEDLTVVGVVQSSDPSATGVLTSGICYEHELIEKITEKAAQSEVVKAQMENRDINVLTGEPFGMKQNEGISMEDLFTVNTDAISQAFAFDESAFVFNAPSIDLSKMDIPDVDTSKLLEGVNIDLSKIDFSKIAEDVADDFVKNNPAMMDQINNMQSYLDGGRPQQILGENINAILDEKMSSAEMQSALTQLQTDLSQDYISSSFYDPSDPTAGLQAYMQSEQARMIMMEWMQNVNITFTQQDIDRIVVALNTDYESVYGTVQTEEIEKQFNAYLDGESFVNVLKTDVMEMIDADGIMEQIMNNASAAYGSAISSASSDIMDSLSSSIVSMMKNGMQNVFSFNGDALKDAFKMNMDMNQFKNAIVSMMSGASTSYDDNMKSFGYTDLSDPSSIVIYPLDFEAKTEVKNIIDGYNKQMEENGEDDKVILYVDAVATLMSSVTDIVNTITYVLIAFVAISLVVSSLMIGIITYISVLERQKEIGILRAIGASKRNVSNVFNAETFITGLLAGVIGIVVTLILLIPGNTLIHALAGNTDVNAVLPVEGAVILIVLSVVLTMIGGIIPSRTAAKSDPVKALRTD